MAAGGRVNQVQSRVNSASVPPAAISIYGKSITRGLNEIAFNPRLFAFSLAGADDSKNMTTL
jgi:hypothetical protein